MTKIKFSPDKFDEGKVTEDEWMFGVDDRACGTYPRRVLFAVGKNQMIAERDDEGAAGTFLQNVGRQ